MTRTQVDPPERRDTNINLRLPLRTRDLIDAAASASGQTRTEFVVSSARQQAIDVLLDQTFFTLEGASARHVLDVLDDPPKPAKALKQLMRTKAPWDK